MSAMPTAIDFTRLETDSKPDGLLSSSLIKLAAVAGFGLLAASFFISLFTNGLEVFLRSYLVNYLFFMAITLGSLLFVVLQHLVRAGWSVVVRRIAEIYASNIFLMTLLFIPILLGMNLIFEWSVQANVAIDPILQHKAPYLNVPFFIVRCIIYFTIWITCMRFFVTRSIQQDQSGDHNLTSQMQGRAAPFMLGMFLSISFFSFDIIMSLDPHWYSTIFGVYFIAECAICVFATIILTATTLQSMGKLHESVTCEHFHDVGKFLFGFLVFWAYIAFSQYMLLWYGNIPEETAWYLRRQEGQWLTISLLLIFGHFILPFFGLISREIKRRKHLLSFWAAWLLIMVWVDIYWLVMPNFSQGVIPFSIYDITCFAGIGLLYKSMAAYSAGQQSLVPLKDPRLHESLSLENF